MKDYKTVVTVSRLVFSWAHGRDGLTLLSGQLSSSSLYFKSNFYFLSQRGRKCRNPSAQTWNPTDRTARAVFGKSLSPPDECAHAAWTRNKTERRRRKKKSSLERFSAHRGSGKFGLNTEETLRSEDTELFLRRVFHRDAAQLWRCAVLHRAHPSLYFTSSLPLPPSLWLPPTTPSLPRPHLSDRTNHHYSNY